MKNKTVYLCKTLELAEIFIKDCENEGLIWRSGHKPTEYNTWKQRFHGSDYVAFYIVDGELSCGSGRAWEDEHNNHTRYADWDTIEVKPQDVSEKILHDGFVCIEADSYEEAVKKFNEKYGNIEQYIVQVKDNETLVVAPTGEIGVAKCENGEDFNLSYSFSDALAKIKTKRLAKTLSDDAVVILQTLKECGCELFYVDDDYSVVGLDDAMNAILTFNEFVTNGLFNDFKIHYTYELKDFINVV